MRAIMVMFDTLTRTYLPNYGNDWVHAPNFGRLADRCCRMENFYASSMPCMPARRDLHTGKYNFLHRGWGPLEPFDNSCIEILRAHGVYTHLSSDHSHYWEDGGCTYHNRYDTWEGFRGQEGDRWAPHDIVPGTMPESLSPLNKWGNVSVTQHYCNRMRQATQNDLSQTKTFDAGMEFLDAHADRDDWFLQIEAFDPHEPFFVPEKYRTMYGLPDEETLFWPRYGEVPGDRDYRDELADCKKEYAALLSMCDESLGRVLDFMDEHDMWKDTVLIVNTDHGFLLGEHEWLGKNFPPVYDELGHLPCFVHAPGIAENGARKSLCSTVDIAPTLLDLFGIDPAGLGDIDGRSMVPVLRDDTAIKDHCVFGMHGCYTCWTDGRHVYMKASKDEANQPLVSFTMMPTNIRGFYSREQLERVELANPGRYSNGCPCMKFHEDLRYLRSFEMGDRLYDLASDPAEEHNLVGEVNVAEFDRKLILALDEAEAPEEEYLRLGLR